MARYINAVCRLCRREGEKLFLKGSKCHSDKCPFEKKSYSPGERGRTRPRETNYLIQLREKQKVKRIYGLMEIQFKNYFKRALKMKGVTGKNLLVLLETRLDNVVYLLGFSSSRPQARQLVNHGHILVNGNKVSIPSYQVKVGQEVGISEKAKKMEPIIQSIAQSSEKEIPGWLQVNHKEFKGRVISIPEREDIDQKIKEQLIVELYSR
jgi:small subunit ribosomal protein S4